MTAFLSFVTMEKQPDLIQIPTQHVERISTKQQLSDQKDPADVVVIIRTTSGQQHVISEPMAPGAAFAWVTKISSAICYYGSSHDMDFQIAVSFRDPTLVRVTHLRPPMADPA